MFAQSLTSHHITGTFDAPQLKLRVVMLLLITTLPSQSFAQSLTVKVPGKSQIQFAGIPGPGVVSNGGTRDPFGIDGFDLAPQNSPVLVDLRLSSGQAVRFAATGQVDLSPRATSSISQRLAGPTGTSFGFKLGRFSVAFRPGTSEISARHGSLIGVFENSTGLEPFPVNFLSALESLTVLEPRMNQPFLIGDGKTPSGGDRTFIVPGGANRLYLAILDNPVRDNVGEYDVQVSIVPRPLSQTTNPAIVLGTSNIMLADLIEEKGWNFQDRVPWNSPTMIDVRRLQAQSVKISASGTVDLDTRITSVTANGTGTNVSCSPNGPLGPGFAIGVGRGFSGIDAPNGSLIGAFVGEQFNTDLNLDF